MADRRYICCICGKFFTGWGISPYPVIKDTNAECCPRCNGKEIIPVRMEIIREQSKKALKVITV